MQDDSVFLLENNPFWDFFYSEYEVMEIAQAPDVQEPDPPEYQLSSESIVSLIIVLMLGFIWFIIYKKSELLRSKNFPDIYFDEKHQWLFYNFPGDEPSIVTGVEEWIPSRFSLDANGAYFVAEKGSNADKQKVPIDKVKIAAVRKASTYIWPPVFVIAGFLVIYFSSMYQYDSSYSEYLTEIEEIRYQQALFNPFSGMCVLNNQQALIPQQMTVNVVYDLPEGSEPPIAIDEYHYLEGDSLLVFEQEYSLPVQPFIFNSPELIVGNADQNINFYSRASGSQNCSEGNTIFLQEDSDTGEDIAYQVPVNDLKELSLGQSSGLYETRLSGFYESEYLINTSSYEIRMVQQSYSVDNLPNCDSLNIGETYVSGYSGDVDSIQGQLVPWGTSPSSTINIPDFQPCSRIQVIEYQ
ncbi:MAG: hypothetical protein CMQ38_08030 [Gammaproteobacteria bacterium]|nr:hypothetical protein [Gammaproteobacteria bacterium]